MLSNCGAGGFLTAPWTARRLSQSILKEINPEYSLEGLMLKLQYFGHLMQKANSLELALMLGKIEGRRRRWQRMRWLDDITDSTDMSLSKLQEMVKDKEGWSCCSPWGRKVSDTTEWLKSNNNQGVLNQGCECVHVYSFKNSNIDTSFLCIQHLN